MARKGVKTKFLLVIILLVFLLSFYFIFHEFKYNIHYTNGAYATFLQGDNYLIGARVLFQSIKETKTKYPFVVMVTEEVTEVARQILTMEGAIIKEVTKVSNPKSDEIRYQWVYTKLRIWEFVEYDRIVFLDADIIVRTNIDELFTRSLPPFCAVSDCCDYFNSGVMVLTPSLAEYRDMEEKIKYLPSYDNGDQGFLNEYYKTTWFKLPYSYNAQQPDFISNKLQWDLEKIKVIHYEQAKPWVEKNEQLWDIHQFWWDIRNNLIFNHYAEKN